VIPIAGVKTAEQVKQNIGALGWQLSKEEFQELEKVSRPWLN
jgi:aryl-alcohol dehydrogenase-like predicted oxidoreductase